MFFSGVRYSLQYGDAVAPASTNLCTFAELVLVAYLLEFCFICIISDCHKSFVSLHNASKAPITVDVLSIDIHSFFKVVSKVEDDLTCYLVRLHYIIVGEIMQSR